MSYFESANAKKFSLSIDNVSETVGLVSFKGHAAISELYYFELTLISDNEDLEEYGADLFSSNVTLTFHKADVAKEHAIHGVFSEFEQIKQTQYDGQNYTLYKARMVPKLWWLTLSKKNQVFLDKSVPEIMAEILADAELSESDYSLSELGVYEDNEYVCQFNESHFDFISRWMEREGIYYFFNHENGTEEIIFADSLTSHEVGFDTDISYKPDRDLSDSTQSRFIQTFTGRKKQLPKRVILKDYNPERPSLEVKGLADVDLGGRGDCFLYGDHFANTEEGDRLALLRAEQILSTQSEFFGESTASAMAPGYLFTLKQHYRDQYNAQYLITEVTHEGSQASCIKSDILTGLGLSSEDVPYYNSFKAIPADVQFRPEQKVQRPRISGTLNAKIDAEGEGDMAELDEFGRYKVKLPFTETEDLLDGKASIWLRMIQANAGENQGIQFPLRKGTDVLISFIDGHPDRPIIAGAVNNPETPGVVSAANHNVGFIATKDMLALRSSGGFHRDVSSRGISDHDGEPLFCEVRDDHEANFNENDWQFPKMDPDGAFSTDAEYNAMTGLIPDNALNNTDIPGEYSGEYIITRVYGNQYNWGDGKVFNWDNMKVFSYGNDYEEIHEIDDPETQEGYQQKLPLTVSASEKDTHLNVNFFNPAGRKGHEDNYGIHYPQTMYGGDYNVFNDPDPWEDGGNGLTEKAWGDKVEFHMGRSFNFSGGPGPGGSNEAYNYGNGYTEDLLEQTHGCFHQHYKNTRHARLFDATAPVKIDVGKASMSKAAGHSYSYTRGTSFEVTEDLNGYSENYGGTSEEYEYTSLGIPRSKTVSKNDLGLTEETIYDVTAGVPVSYSTESTRGGGVASFSVSMGADVSLETKLATSLVTTVAVGAISEIGLYAGVKMDMSAGAGLLIELAGHAGGHIKLDNGDTDIKLPGLRIEAPPPLTMEAVQLEISSKTTEIENKVVAIRKHTASLNSNIFTLADGLGISL